MTAGTHRSGVAALIGRPNVGKSTLLNRLVGSKISITSRRPQTTRHRILGIRTDAHAQVVFVDTPGLDVGAGSRMDRYMRRIASGSVEGVDIVALVIDAGGWRPEDEPALALAQRQTAPVILVINKIDKRKSRSELLPLMAQSATRSAFAAIAPVSARTGDNLDELLQAIVQRLPRQPPIYPTEQRTDRDQRFFAAELVREQVFSAAGQEVPYATTVQIERFKRVQGMLRVDAVIWVEKDGQKAILIGKQGARLKQMGTRARTAMEQLFGTRVYLNLWVKVRAGWSDDAATLRRFGYEERH